MTGIFSRLIRQSGLYAVLNLGVKLSGLLVLPLYLNLLTTETFGHFALLDATARVAILVADLGIATGVLRFMSTAEHADRHAVLPFTALVTAAAAASVMLAAFWAAALDYQLWVREVAAGRRDVLG